MLSQFKDSKNTKMYQCQRSKYKIYNQKMHCSIFTMIFWKNMLSHTGNIIEIYAK